MTQNLSSFTLSFAVEVLGAEEWQDYPEGLFDVSTPPIYGCRISYVLYPGTAYDIDVVMWAYIAKVWCRGQSQWVRTWLHLGRRWVAFSIRHALRLNIYAMRQHNIVATMKDGLSNVGAEARNDKTTQVFIPKLDAGERRQFAKVIENPDVYYGISSYFYRILWGLVEDHIPSSHLDGKKDSPSEVTDVRHQDAILRAVELETFRVLENPVNTKIHTNEKAGKAPEKTKGGGKGAAALELRITGDTLLSDLGYVTMESISFPETGSFSIVMSSQNLPPRSEHPVFFVKIHKLNDLPVETLTKMGFTDVYTRWQVFDEEHCSLAVPIEKSILFKDSRAIPLEPHRASDVVIYFQDVPFNVEIRAQKNPSQPSPPKFFGSSRSDKDFGTLAWLPHPQVEESDFKIAVCPIDLKNLKEGNKTVRGCFPVVPLKLPDQKVPTAVILESSPTLTLTVGLVGCRPKPIRKSFCRLLCYQSDQSTTTEIVEEITLANEEVLSEDLLTGWVVSWGQASIIYVEGPRDSIVDLWMKTIYMKNSKPSFSSDMTFSSRIYYKYIERSTPFQTIALQTSPNVILERPKMSSQPVLLLPARDALLKLGRLEMCGIDQMWCPQFLPTDAELGNLKILLEEESDFRKLFQ